MIREILLAVYIGISMAMIAFGGVLAWSGRGGGGVWAVSGLVAAGAMTFLVVNFPRSKDP